MVAWYAGAERLYGYPSEEAIGRDTSLFYLNEDAQRTVEEELNKAAAEGHAGTEGWQVKKEGSRFWANVITRAAGPNQLVNGSWEFLPAISNNENSLLYIAAP